MNEEIEAILNCPMDVDNNGCKAATVGEYLSLLLSTLWLQNDEFSGKRPFGNSGWEYDVYIALYKNGLIHGLVLDEDGYVDSFSHKAQITADEQILQAISHMGKPQR